MDVDGTIQTHKQKTNTHIHASTGLTVTLQVNLVIWLPRNFLAPLWIQIFMAYLIIQHPTILFLDLLYV